MSRLRQLSALFGCCAMIACSDSPTRPHQVAASITLTPDTPAIIVGASSTMSATVLDASGQPMSAQISWASSAPSIATISPTGTVQAKAFGQTRVTATAGSVSASTVVSVIYPARDSALVRAGDSTRVSTGQGTSVTIPADVFPAGTRIVLQEIANEADTASGEPIGNGVSLRIVGPSSSGAARSAVPGQANISFKEIRVTVSRKVGSGIHYAADEVWGAVKSTGKFGEKAIIKTTDVVEKVGEFGDKTIEFVYTIPQKVGNAAGAYVYDYHISPFKGSDVCASSDWALYRPGHSRADPGPANPDRIPLILVHGWQRDHRTCGDARNYRSENDLWNDIIADISTKLASRYEVWVFSYPTFYPVDQSAARLKIEINNAQRGLANRDAVIVAHSMGGLVSAKYMADNSGNHVRRLFTLGTPFNGSPLAVHLNPDLAGPLESCTVGLGVPYDFFLLGPQLNTSGARDLRPGSDFLKGLEAQSSAFSTRLQSFAGRIYWTALDLTQHGVLAVPGCALAGAGYLPNDGAVETASAIKYVAGDAANTRIRPGVDHLELPHDQEVRDSLVFQLAVLGAEVPTLPTGLQVAGGEGQTSIPGSVLPQPISVRVVDRNGVPVPKVSVAFSVTSGGGSVDPATVQTDEHGIARAAWRLGAAAGQQTAAATATGLAGSPAVFHATASDIPAPAIHAHVSAGNDHACAVTDTGKGYCWGSNTIGSLGNDNATDGSTPGVVSGNHAFVQIASGGDGGGSGQYEHSCGVTTDGTGYCWGSSTWGELGTTVSTCGTQKQGACVPVPVEGNHKFSAIATGNLHSCGITTDGTAYCWGYGGFGALGTGAPVSQSFTPLLVAGGLKFSVIDAARYWTCALTEAGAAYCWGLTGGGLGSIVPGEMCNSFTCSPRPTLVSGGLTFEVITVGGGFSCGVTRDQDAYCWGSNNWGQLGDGTTTDSPVPVKVTGGLKFTTIDAGAEHVCAVSTTGAAYCWGQGLAGNLGNGTEVESHVPAAVSGGHVFRQISAGTGFSCGTTTTSQIYCWGFDSSGKLGNGPAGASTIPVFVMDASASAGVRRAGMRRGR